MSLNLGLVSCVRLLADKTVDIDWIARSQNEWSLKVLLAWDSTVADIYLFLQYGKVHQIS